jgi:hypothetical protein
MRSHLFSKTLLRRVLRSVTIEKALTLIPTLDDLDETRAFITATTTLFPRKLARRIATAITTLIWV